MSLFGFGAKDTAAAAAARAGIVQSALVQVQQQQDAATNSTLAAQLEQLLAQQAQAEADAAAARAYDEGLQPKKTSPLVYVGLGIGALVLVGILASALKGKSKVSGYRRRRGRSHHRASPLLIGGVALAGAVVFLPKLFESSSGLLARELPREDPTQVIS